MKEIALIGTNSQVYADVLSALLSGGLSVRAMVENPERIMLDDTRLVVSRYDYADPDATERDLEGYSTLVMAYDDNLRDSAADDIALRYFASTLTAAERAGVKRVIVVGSPQSEAFFAGNMRRRDGLDWVFISTEGDFAQRAFDQVVKPTYHKEVYA